MNNTKQRQIIYDTVANSYSHPTADEVFKIVRQSMPNISLGTVYRNLGVLTDIGKIRKIAVPGSADHFDRMSEPHDHMVCECCGHMYDIALPHESTLAEQISQISGMKVTNYWLMANCICKECEEKHQEKNKIS